jgi:DNA-binding NarL/FixJ family response regulator
MLTVSTAEDDVLDALAAGACGYVLKSTPPEEVVQAIGAAHRGESTISSAVAGRLVERVRASRANERPPPPASLTPREIEILRLVAQGKENHEIAEALFISVSTAKNHVASVLDKLGMHNRVQAAVYAVRAGLV